MNIVFHKQFKKAFCKQPAKVQKQFAERLGVFEKNPFDPMLNNHALRGEHKDKRSINITGDVRTIYVVYESRGEDIIFIDIGSHSDLYG